jgi:thioredoxin reductase
VAAAGESADVLIIGLGPCGLMAGLTLARYDVDVRCIEQRAGGSSLSRAPVVSTRGMDVARWATVDAAPA